MLFVVCVCSLFVVCRSLLVFRRLRFAVCCSLFVVVVCVFFSFFICARWLLCGVYC